ncbi:hypothetical protein K8Z61_02605 [Nocardioides sp. TRM66260-LWL]|uniref:HGxxPAAW family protein n=1 Tax=Nocardioides sp. TRM66260-LWL TaxID=2874478 RepID=UPI001CC4A968|nr:HGxxPAAW family protein [Nocardioides sp. TRM66260-LWL]MBZ5733377.1 hypothetical protein [Nocardioides sp. TRM66260-LWL]
MSSSHGNTPAAWTAVVVGLLGFIIGSIGLLLDPISYPVFIAGVVVTLGAGVVFGVLAKLGYHEGH